MSQIRYRLSTISLLMLSFPLFPSIPTPAEAQQARPIQCEKRSATATPPPFTAAPRREQREGHGGGPYGAGEAAARPKPICPEGEVPVLHEIRPDRRGFGKGNPLLRTEPRTPTPGAPQTRGALAPRPFLNFSQVYGPRTGRRGPTPPSPPGEPPCDGLWQDNACYYYGAAGLQGQADGGGMTMSVNRPAYDDSGGPGHSLDEIAVQGGSDNGNIIEMGWLVSSDMNGDADPHIFVFHWVNGTPSCYNGCGWQQYSNTYYPSQNASSILGREVYVGYVFWQGNWWGWFDDQWMGYFPGSIWNGEYTQNSLIQWFGEVASLNGIPPKTQMGDGIFPPSASAAHMFTLCDVDAEAWVCWIRDQQSITPPNAPEYYGINRVGFGDMRYGGPGS